MEEGGHIDTFYFEKTTFWKRIVTVNNGSYLHIINLKILF